MTKKNKTTADYLETLEELKKQYQQYLEVSRLYELPTFQEAKGPEIQPASLEHPLTTNTISVKQ